MQSTLHGDQQTTPHLLDVLHLIVGGDTCECHNTRMLVINIMQWGKNFAFFGYAQNTLKKS